jgi:hypothetical protein
VRLVDGVGILVAELVHDAGDALVVLRVEGIPDEALELEGAAFALVVELVVERLSDVRVHVGGVCKNRLYMAMPRGYRRLIVSEGGEGAIVKCGRRDSPVRWVVAKLEARPARVWKRTSSCFSGRYTPAPPHSKPQPAGT